MIQYNGYCALLQFIWELNNTDDDLLIINGEREYQRIQLYFMYI